MMVKNFDEQIDQEFNIYVRKMESLPKGEIIARAQAIANMASAYDYLKNGGLDESDKTYLAQAANPIAEVCGFHETLDSAYYVDLGEHPYSLTVHDIITKDLFNDPDVKKAVNIDSTTPGHGNASFFRKAVNISTLMDKRFLDDVEPYKITKIIEVPKSTYIRFSHNLSEEQAFIQNNINCMVHDDLADEHRCILVKTSGFKEGILVNSEGFGYARYAAYVRDCNDLNLNHIPRERYGREQNRRINHRNRSGR